MSDAKIIRRAHYERRLREGVYPAAYFAEVDSITQSELPNGDRAVRLEDWHALDVRWRAWRDAQQPKRRKARPGSQPLEGEEEFMRSGAGAGGCGGCGRGR